MEENASARMPSATENPFEVPLTETNILRIYARTAALDYRAVLHAPPPHSTAFLEYLSTINKKSQICICKICRFLLTWADLFPPSNWCVDRRYRTLESATSATDSALTFTFIKIDAQIVCWFLSKINKKKLIWVVSVAAQNSKLRYTELTQIYFVSSMRF